MARKPSRAVHRRRQRQRIYKSKQHIRRVGDRSGRVRRLFRRRDLHHRYRQCDALAVWTAISYAITFNKNDAAATGTMPMQSIASGSSASLMANTFTKAGWSFAGWATAPAGAVAYNNGATYTMGNNDVILYAVWIAYSLTVTFDKNDGPPREPWQCKAYQAVHRRI